ncbi:hypothetical protein [Micromonospora sp. NPDC049102]|uniref:hypothetical protein n=1 Tax=Micromonospora sp. NPDC049102 TaxID=3364265 RepID=UPI00371E74CE
MSLAVAIVLGATSMSDIEMLTHQGLIFGEPPSEATVRRALSGLDEAALKRIGKARAKVRARSGISWPAARKGFRGLPWPGNC